MVSDKEADIQAVNDSFGDDGDAQAEEQAAPSIKNLGELKAQWSKNKLPPRIHVALKAKLIELYKAASIHEDEESLLWAMLNRERINGSLTDADGYILHAHEASECVEQCRVKINDAPATHGLVKDAVMKFRLDGDTNKFHIYPIRVVPGDHQLDMETAKRIAAGITVDPASFPKPRKLTRHIVINQKEFDRWFEVVDDSLLEAEESKYEGLIL